MGGYIQKGKSPSTQQNNKNKTKSQLLPVSEADLKEKVDLGNYRWFYSSDIKNWEMYNLLSEEKKTKCFMENISIRK